MSFKLFHTSLLALVMCGTAASSALAAPPTGPLSPEKMASMAGGMQVLGKACGNFTPEQLAQLKEQHRKDHIRRGGDPKSFEAAYSQGIQAAVTGWGKMTAAQRTQVCAKSKTGANKPNFDHKKPPAPKVGG